MRKNKVKREAWKSFFIFFPAALLGIAICIWAIGRNGFKEMSGVDLVETLVGLLIALGCAIGSVIQLFDVRRAKAVTTGEIKAVVSPEEENPDRTASDRPSHLYTCRFTYTVNNQEYTGSQTVSAPAYDPDRVYDYTHAKIEVYYDPKRPENNWPVLPPLDAVETHTESPDTPDALERRAESPDPPASLETHAESPEPVVPRIIFPDGPESDPENRAEAVCAGTGPVKCRVDGYYGITNPGIYTGDDEKILLLYSLQELNIGHPHDETDYIVYIYGTYYLHHLFGDRTAAGDDYYPFPYDLLDENNSISFGDLAVYCEKCEPYAVKLTERYCRNVAQKESARHGINSDLFRYWREDDRITLLHPFGKSAYFFGYSGNTSVYFRSMTDRTTFSIPWEQFRRDRDGSAIPEVVYRDLIARKQQFSSDNR